MTDFRALCAELLAALEFQLDDLRFNNRLCIRARAALAEPQGPAKNCWLDDEPDLCPSSCVFDDPREDIDNCTYARQLHIEGKCKTDCQYYQPTSENA
jgi:hypothetical protein